VLTFAFIPDEFDSDVGEDELDEELALPEVLRSISYEEKRELYRFKHTHNEVEWDLHPPPLTGVTFVIVCVHREIGKRKCFGAQISWPVRSIWSVSSA
jgi:hypothetical protein